MNAKERAKAEKQIRENFEACGIQSFVITENPSRTWGYTAALYFGGWKLDTASGCGYDKNGAMLEAALRILTGHSVSLGGHSLEQATAYVKQPDGTYKHDREILAREYSLEYSQGRTEIHCTLTRKGTKS